MEQFAAFVERGFQNKINKFGLTAAGTTVNNDMVKSIVHDLCSWEKGINAHMRQKERSLL
jgi:hypothetical protein